MKNLIIGVGVIVLLLVGAFVFTNKKEVTPVATITDTPQEVPTKKTYPKIRQEYSLPTPQRNVIQRQVVTQETTKAVAPPPTIVKAPPVPVIPADMTPPEVPQKKVKIPAQALQKGALVTYSGPSDLDNLSGTNILFFKASWCITCTMLYDKLKEELVDIPAGVTIWVVDYDSNEALRRSYGVTSQHTLVQIDVNQNKINLWRGGFSLAEVMSNVK